MQYYRDELYLNDTGVINTFPGNNDSSKFKRKVIGETKADCAKDVEIMVLLKCLSNFWRTLEMSLINCEINLILTFQLCYI